MVVAVLGTNLINGHVGASVTGERSEAVAVLGTNLINGHPTPGTVFKPGKASLSLEPT